MKMSEKTRSELYASVSKPIEYTRLKLNLNKEQDKILLAMLTEIWDGVKKTLKLKDIF